MTVSLLERHFLKREAAAATTVVAASVVVNLTLLVVTGVRTGGDSVRYVQGADNLLAGRPLEGMQALFPGYIALVAASTKIGAGFAGVVLAQIAVAAVATFTLFRIGVRLSNITGGTIAALLFALNLDIARWHLFVLTDSLYISCVIFAAYVVHEATERGGWSYAAAMIVVLIAASLRPQGRLLAVASAIYWVVRRPAVNSQRVAAVVAAGVMLIVVVATSGATLRAEAETPARWLGDGVVIWSHAESRLVMPKDETVDLLSAGATSVDPLRYALRHPIATARLAATRVIVEVAHVRPFYSRTHNLVAIVWLGATYVCAIVGFMRVRRQPLAHAIALIVGLHVLFIAATFADWDGRFLLYVLPLVNVYAAAALA